MSQSEPTVFHPYFSVFLNVFNATKFLFFQTFNKNLDVICRVTCMSEQRGSQFLSRKQQSFVNKTHGKKRVESAVSPSG